MRKMKKTMKRSLAVILTVLMLMSAVPFAGFAIMECPKCGEFVDAFLTEGWAATCEETGMSDNYTCTNCGETILKGKVIPAKGHDYEKVEAQDATCLEEGNIEYFTCKNCDKLFVEQTGLGENEQPITIKVETTLEAVTTAKAAHEWETYTPEDDTHLATPATCIAKATYYKYCPNCKTYSDTETFSVDTDAEPTHEFGEWFISIEPTCTEPGEKKRECANCDAFETEPVEATGHDKAEDVDWTYSEGFDCTVGGTRTKVCHCGEVIVPEETVEPASHMNVNIPEKAPTCTEDGNTTGAICSVCGKVIYAGETLPALGHKIGETLEKVDSKEAKCEEAGNIEHYKCKFCEKCFVEKDGELEEIAAEDTVLAAPGHTHKSVTALAPTCAEKGHEAGVVCSVCDAVISGAEEIPALGHVLDVTLTKTEAKDAKCDEDGNREYFTCKDCEKNFLEVEGEYVEAADEEIILPALGHDPETTLVKTPAVEESCDTDGNIEYYTCSDCGAIFTYVEEELTEITADDTVVPAAHDFVKVDEKSEDATCIAEGVLFEKCSRCEETRETPVPALGHDFSEEWTIDKETSCKEAGQKSHHCNACGIKTDITEIPQLEHSYEVEGEDATCLDDGEKFYTCTECGYSYSEKIKAPGKHTDLNSDGKCDKCGEQSCDCICHKDNIFYKFFYWIFKIWWEYLGINETCACGAVHYSKTVF